MSVTEPSNAFNAGKAIQTEGRRLAHSGKSPPSDSSLVGLLVLDEFHVSRPRLVAESCVQFRNWPEIDAPHSEMLRGASNTPQHSKY